MYIGYYIYNIHAILYIQFNRKLEVGRFDIVSIKRKKESTVNDMIEDTAR